MAVDSDFKADRMSQWLSEAQGSWKEPSATASISAPKLASMPTFRSPKSEVESEDTEDSVEPKWGNDGQPHSENDAVLYREREGGYKLARVVKVDNAMDPPGYVVEVDGAERSTEASRLAPAPKPRRRSDGDSSLNRQMDELAARADKIHIADSPKSLGLRENEKPLPPHLDQYGSFTGRYAGSLPPSETGLTDYGDYTDLDAMIKIAEEKQRKQRSGDDKWDKE
jgi:hypothetical protein